MPSSPVGGVRCHLAYGSAAPGSVDEGVLLDEADGNVVASTLHGGVGGDCVGSEGMLLDEADGNDEGASWLVQSSPKFDGSERK